MAKPSSKIDKQKTNEVLPDLHKWNVWFAWIHLAQAIIVLVLSATRLFPVTTNYQTLDPAATDIAGHPVLAQATRHLFDINLAYFVAAFFVLAAIAHGLVATVYRVQYEADLKKKTNRVRWIEYALSVSLMMVVIAVVSGVADLSTLIMIFALDVVMTLCGFAMELYNQGKAKPNWLSYGIGTYAGLVPWLVFAIYAWGSNLYGDGNIPGYVYGIYATIFLLFSGTAVNMYLHYKKVGKWSDYLYAERVYMILSLVAKTLLAWQVFAGSLRP